jgi:murein DD-endopeptidase MepM/ murein hydrolase activator NlpD
VVAFTFFAKVRIVAGAIAALTSLAVSQPALANSSASSADVTAPLRAAPAARTAPGGDEQFRTLFNGWKSMDSSASFATTPTGNAAATPMFRPASVAVPSRMPVEGASLTSGFGVRNHPVLGGRRQHRGVDLAMPTGTPVYATADGVISKAEWFSSYGLYISVEHGAAIQNRYGHLSRLAVAAGQPVKKGDLIGYVGSTGRSTGPHLHYEVRIAGAAVNPVPYMQGNVRNAPVATPLPVTTWAQGGGDDE